MTTEELFDQFPRLETKRLELIKFQPEFAQEFFELLRDPRVNQHETREPFTELTQAERYVHYRQFITRKKSEGIIWAVSLRRHNEVIGDIGYNPQGEFIAEVGFKLHPDYWNQGLMSEALQAVIGFLFKKTNSRRIEAFTRPANRAAASVLTKNSFQNEGVLRECQYFKDESYDLALYALLKCEYPKLEENING